MTKIRFNPADRSTRKFRDMNEPTGFVNRTDSTLDLTSDRFTINPVVTSFDYYIKGRKYTVSSSDVENVNYVDLADTEGLHYVYYDGTTLTVEVNPSDDAVETIWKTKSPVVIIYWDATNDVGIYVGEERHGIQMDGAVHSYLHFTRGLQYHSGLALNTIDADQNGSSDSHAQFGIDVGDVEDEDLDFAISAVGSTDGLNIYYRDGATGVWRRTTQANFAVKVTGTGRLAWNEFTGGSWQLTEVADNKFVLYHIFTTTEKDNPMISIIGQNTYLTQSAAREGATTEINSLLLGNLPTPEIRPIATVIFQTKDSYTNSVNARIRTTDEGDDYIDWRKSEFGRGVAAGDHGSLGGLFDDDHPFAAWLPGRSGGQTLIGGTDSGDNLTLQSTSHATRGTIRMADNVDMAKFLAVGSEAYILSNSAVYIYHKFETNADNRGLTATVKQMVPVYSPNYSKALGFELNYWASGVGDATFVGGGLDDMTTGGINNGVAAANMRVEIDSEGGGGGGVDTFKWSNDNGVSWEVENVDIIAGTPQILENLITIEFTAGTGHTLGDYWNFDVAAESYRLIGIHGHAQVVSTAGRINGMRGILGTVIHKGKGLIGSAVGGRNSIELSGGGTINLGANSAVSNLAINAGTITHLAGFWVENPNITGSGVVTNFYGLYLPTFTGAGAAWGIYQIGTNPNYFGGDVGIGTNAPDSLLHIKGNTPGIVGVGSHHAGQLIIQNPAESVWSNAVITGYDSDANGNPRNQLWYLGSASGGNSDIIFLNRRNSKLQLGTAGTAKMTILGNGNVGINEASPSAKLEVGGDVLVKDKIAFTQDDKDEYIDSLADGYMDYGATTGHRFNSDIFLLGDNRMIAFGADGAADSYILYDGGELDILSAGAISLQAGTFIDINTELDMTTHKIVNVVDPVDDQDVATKKFVLDNAGGVLSDIANYKDCVASGIDNIVSLRPWFSDPAILFPMTIVNVRNVQVQVLPDGFPGNFIIGTVTVDGVDSDGKVVQEIFTFNTDEPEIQVGDVQFAIITQIACVEDGASGTGFWSLGIGDKLGFQNYPWNAEGDVIKVSRNGAYFDPLGYAVDPTNGTIDLSIIGGINLNDYYTVWYRPNK